MKLALIDDDSIQCGHRASQNMGGACEQCSSIAMQVIRYSPSVPVTNLDQLPRFSSTAASNNNGPLART